MEDEEEEHGGGDVGGHWELWLGTADWELWEGKTEKSIVTPPHSCTIDTEFYNLIYVTSNLFILFFCPHRSVRIFIFSK